MKEGDKNAFFREKSVYLGEPAREAGLPLDMITYNIRVTMPKFAQKRQFRVLFRVL